MKRDSLYIETFIACDPDALWEHTQNPELHQQWDLRFSEIKYLPKSHPSEPQKFLYATRIGFGIKVSGVGESVGTKSKDNGESTSVLKFSSTSPISIIRQGSGYWKYLPEPGGIRFITGYDYDTRWGFFGELIDKFIFRPLMVSATAWSFDCLKNWLEKDIHPRQAILSLRTILLASFVSALVWIYHGLIPKLLFTHTGELELLSSSGLFRGFEQRALTLSGIAEILFGLGFLFTRRKFMFVLNIAILVVLAAGAAFSKPLLYAMPFNPFSLSISLIGLSLVAIWNFRYLPRASHCITKPGK